MRPLPASRTKNRAAPSACADRGIGMTGTIGILKACSIDGTLSPQQADDILEAMIGSGFNAPVRRISDLL